MMYGLNRSFWTLNVKINIGEHSPFWKVVLGVGVVAAGLCVFFLKHTTNIKAEIFKKK